ncbi:MAG: deaminase [Bacillus subtilis]|nr:deaminase [Bacillus subtilis]
MRNYTAKASNQKEINNDATQHAEILAIQQAAKATGAWRLDNTAIYITLEPCPIKRVAAILHTAESLNVYFGTYDPRIRSVWFEAMDMTGINTLQAKHNRRI